MRRHAKLALTVVLLLLAGTGAVYAQDETPAPEAILEEVQAVATSAAEAVAEAEALNDFAFNLLGIFEAISVAITIVGAALGAFGFARIISAQDSLVEARDEVRAEMADIQERLNTELSELNQQFDRRSESLAALSVRTEKIIEEQRKVIADATLATVLLSFGERQFKASDYTGAIDAYNRALQLDSRNPVISYRLGYVYTTRGDLDMAEDHLTTSLEMDDEFTPAKVALGLVYRRKGEKMEEGIERERLFNEAERWMILGLQTSPKLID
ncbi:MAG: tetratricopeptide repeat protein, partial [Chloroflexota bacterium]